MKQEVSRAAVGIPSPRGGEEVKLPLVVFNDPGWWTIPLGVQQFQGQYAADWARILAYVVLAMVPALGFYAVAERRLVGGLTAGATKG
ncbi:hypothetical protein ACFV1N_42955 [Streptosporangium canum]|uniref:hypothetical protein n=1 Tax=Streptosporangium canum TaxID=324952 RepID=UPI0036AB3036